VPGAAAEGGERSERSTPNKAKTVWRRLRPRDTQCHRRFEAALAGLYAANTLKPRGSTPAPSSGHALGGFGLWPKSSLYRTHAPQI